MDITITLDRSEQADYIYQQIYPKAEKRNPQPQSASTLKGSLQTGAG